MIQFEKENFDFVCIPSPVLEALLAMPGDYLRVYCYGLLHKEASREQIMEELQLSAAQFAETVEALQKAGVIQVVPSDQTKLTYTLPQRKEKKVLLNEIYPDADYNMMVQSIFGDRILKHTDYRTIYECSEVYGLPKQVVIMLLETCVSKYGKRVPAKMISDEALRWVRSGIDSIERAQDYIETQRMITEDAKMVMQQLRVRNKELSRDFLELYEKWTKQWGLSLGVITQGVAETNTKANAPSINYLNKVLESYYKKGLSTPKTVDEYEKRTQALREDTRKMLEEAGVRKVVSKGDVNIYLKFQEQYKMPANCIFFAAQCAYGYKNPMKVMDKILKEWQDAGIHTLEQARKHSEAFKKSVGKAKRNPALEYEQREYSKEDLEARVYDPTAEMED